MFKFRKSFSIRDSPQKVIFGKETLNSPLKFTNKLQASPITFKKTKFPTSPIKFTTKSLVIPERIANANGQCSPANLNSNPVSTIGYINTNVQNSPVKTVNNIENKDNDEINANGVCSSTISELNMEIPVEQPNSKRIKLSLEQIKAKKKERLEELKQQLTNKTKLVQEFKKNIMEIKKERYFYEDYINVINKCQLQIRNYLNNMYNPGNEFAKNAKDLMIEKRQAHEKKLEALSFDLSELLESSELAIERKSKQLTHEIELHERTLYTLENRNGALNNKHQYQQQEVEIIKDKNVSDCNVIESSHSEIREESRSVRFEPDDECVIIDGDESKQDDIMDNDNSASQDKQAKTEDNQDSETTNLVEDYDEDEQATDIEEESLPNEDERSFTPCQAQRPQ